MTTANQIIEIISLYNKYGWNLQSLLLSAEVKKSVEKDLLDSLDEIEIINSTIDAVWFSRPSKNKQTAWELRHLNANPFAIFELIDENCDETIKNEILKKAETRLLNHASNNFTENGV